MSASISQSPAWRLAAIHLRSFFQLPAPPEVFEYPFADSDVAMLHTVSADPVAAATDAQTWDQLLLPHYLTMLGQEASIFGRQVMHQRLRAGQSDAPCATQIERVRALMQVPHQLEQMHAACQPLRKTDMELAGPLFDASACPVQPVWIRLLPLAMLGACGAAFFSGLAWVLVVPCMLLLMAFNVQYHALVQRWARLLNSLQQMLAACSELGRHGHFLLAPFADIGARAAQINRAIAFPLGESMSPIGAYREWFMLGKVKDYFRLRQMVDANRDFLRESYLLIANFEADVALARHLLHTPVYCWAERRAGTDITFEQVVHPLLEHAAPLSIALHGKGAFISGRNGVGKSTLLRTMGLNLLVARAFGFCYAHAATVPRMPVYASMQGEDSLLGGESLYIAELRRARELLAAANGPHPGICIIDEIFRGTNHLESVSAAASVLDELAAQGMVIVSSHNLVLAPLLAHRLVPLCVHAPIDGQPLALVPGVLAHTNGIDLLSEHGFSTQVQANARKVFDWFGAYLAHPADCDHVLTAPGAPAAPQQRQAVHQA